jgi:flavin-dependent dehydrogenase
MEPSATGKKWLGLKAHYAEPSSSASVDLYFFRGGYCGVQPIGNGSINVCAVVRSDVASTLDEVFQLHPALRARSAAWQQLTPQVATSPLLFSKPHPWGEKIFRVGDAAGFIDPFAGDGISLALLSGKMAAAQLARFLADEISLEEAGENYAEAYRKSLAPLFRRTSWLRLLSQSPRPLRTAALKAMQIPAFSKAIVRDTRAIRIAG